MLNEQRINHTRARYFFPFLLATRLIFARALASIMQIFPSSRFLLKEVAETHAREVTTINLRGSPFIDTRASALIFYHENYYSYYHYYSKQPTPVGKRENCRKEKKRERETLPSNMIQYASKRERQQCCSPAPFIMSEALKSAR